MVELSIIVPCHNEEENIKGTLEALGKAIFDIDYEIVVVDDNSADQTQKVVLDVSKKNERVRLVKRTRNNGFGLALSEGIRASRGKYIVFFMADQSDDANDIPKMLEKAKTGFDIVIGSRFVHGGRTFDYPANKMACNRLCNFAIAVLFDFHIKDYTNAFKLFRKEILDGVGLNRPDFSFTVESILKPMKLNNAKVAQVPTTWKNRKFGEAKLNIYKEAKNYVETIAECLFLERKN